MKKIFLFLIVLQIITYAQTEKKSWSDYKNLVKDSVTASEARVKNAIKDSITANSQGFQKASDVSGLINDSLTANSQGFQNATQVKTIVSDSVTNKLDKDLSNLASASEIPSGSYMVMGYPTLHNHRDNI